MTDLIKQSNKRSVAYGRKTIEYYLFHVDRKTLEIAVHPDGVVVVKAPLDANIEQVETKIVKKSDWILKQQSYFSQFNPRTPERCFVNGETHLYLGKQYRLKIQQGAENSVKLVNGFFSVTCLNAVSSEIAKKLLEQWYLERAKTQFRESLDRCWHRFESFGYAKPEIHIMKMQKRWGSLPSSSKVILNKDLIRMPKDCIDYVVAHELCHLKVNNHSADFYSLLAFVMPDWEKHKNKLELYSV